MGSKVTIDSATLVNKCLELIEAKYLFDLDEKYFDLVVHPQSIIHSIVTYIDGSSICQMSSPDMRFQ
jgi:1-deoxy-D-xylulose-5-phosphate reductoisomerase